MAFLTVYFASGFFGAAFNSLAIWALPNHFDAYVVGASAGVMGLLAVYAMLFPMRELTYFVYFFPITIRAQYLFWLALLFSIYGTIRPYGHVADAAHLGGLLMGVGLCALGT